LEARDKSPAEIRSMFILTIKSLLALASAVAFQVMPAEPTMTYIAEAKTNSLVSSVLAVVEIPHPPEKSLLDEVEGEMDEEGVILDRIAFCESGGKHFDENGKVIRGKQNPSDIGKYQINMFYHYETALKLGYDIFTEDGNEKYALWLYQKNGTRDWEYSRGCWELQERGL